MLRGWTSLREQKRPVIEGREEGKGKAKCGWEEDFVFQFPESIERSRVGMQDYVTVDVEVFASQGHLPSACARMLTTGFPTFILPTFFSPSNQVLLWIQLCSDVREKLLQFADPHHHHLPRHESLMMLWGRHMFSLCLWETVPSLTPTPSAKKKS